MNKKYFFLGYFFIIMFLFYLVPIYEPDISSKEYASLFFSYQNQPLMLMVLSILSIFFDYLSFFIPKVELSSIREFCVIRQPNMKYFGWVYFKYMYPYFSMFVLMKLSALIICGNKSILIWIVISILEWFIFFSINLRLKKNIPNSLFLVIFIFVRIIAQVSFK